jgi:GT2 family glycosyltransferase
MTDQGSPAGVPAPPGAARGSVPGGSPFSLASLHRHRPAVSRVTVVVLTYNRADEVLQTLAELRTLPERPPIIVVDNGSTDDTAVRIARRFPEVRLIRCDSNLGAAGRNRGVEAVGTPYVAFCDDDTCWQAGALQRAEAMLDRYPRVGALSCRVTVGRERAEDPTCTRMAASPLRIDEVPAPALIGLMAGACVMRTALFRCLGGYAPRLFIGGEEALLSLDLLESGAAIVYAADVTTHHRPSPVRDTPQRRRLLARNALWVACMRLPLAEVARAAWQCLKLAATAPGGAALLAQTIAGLPWALSQRRIVAQPVLTMRRQVAQTEAALSTAAGSPNDNEKAQ